MNINDLPCLTNIIDTFDKIVNDLNEYCGEHEQLEIIESVMVELDEYIDENIFMYMFPKFEGEVDRAIENIVQEVLSSNDGIDKDHVCYEQLYETIINKTKQIYFTIRTKRSHKTNSLLRIQRKQDKDKIKNKIGKIDEINKNLPEQRTEEWYKMRYNLLSASSIWKALDSQCNINALIYDKCKPLNTEKYNVVNVNTPFHWGQKYEPVAQMYYEYKYNAEITEYGCIPHSKYTFLGASPDGINTNYKSSRYGRMLEIKNIVNREITGIPKKEYWVQTQLQMECCDLDECDFLECRFKEYENEEEFENDGDFQNSKEGYYKGIMIQFFLDGKPYYEYMTFNQERNEFNIWYNNIMEYHESKNHTWIKNIYWKLEEISCVLIERNREWFDSVLEKFRNVWDLIENERVSGYEHRKPKRRGEVVVKKTNDVNSTKINTGVCNISLNLESSKVNNEEKENKKNKKSSEVKNMVISIDTSKI